MVIHILSAIDTVFQMIIIDKLRKPVERIRCAVVPFQYRNEFLVGIDIHSRPQLFYWQVEYYPFIVRVPEHFITQRTDVLLLECDKPVLYFNSDASAALGLLSS